jgi:peptidoglycan/xylan/chitin deacetylase (PgdA/CDA1 family)
MRVVERDFVGYGRNAPATTKALARAPEVARAAVEAGHEICSHGLRWEEVFHLTREEEREHIREAVDMTTGGEFFDYARSSFDVLHQEAQTHPKMMSVGLHCRIVGRPGRIGGLDEFLGYIGSFDDVWVTTRADIARWWHAKRAEGAV